MTVTTSPRDELSSLREALEDLIAAVGKPPYPAGPIGPAVEKATKLLTTSYHREFEEITKRVGT